MRHDRNPRRRRRTKGPRRESRTPLLLKTSTSIDAAEYDWKRQILRVRFKPGKASHRGGTYDYFDVPETVVRDFLGAASLDQFVNWWIKPSYEYKKAG